MTAFEDTAVNTAPIAAADALETAGGELQLKLVELKQSGVDRFNPVLFCFIESMVRRARELRTPVAELVEHKAQNALDAYLADFANAKTAAKEPAKKPQLQHQGALVTLTQQLQQGASEVQPSSLDALLQQQERDFLCSDGNYPASSVPVQPGAPSELKSVSLFRESWAKISSDKLVSDSIKEGPENPGPLNQHALAIRSLKAMRDLSPQYLNRFVSYIETVLWLEQAGDGIEAGRKKKGKGKTKTSARRKYF